MSGGIKHDQGKAPMSLLPHESLVEVAKVLGFGARKYEAFNWMKGFPYSRLTDAAMRHLGEFNSGINEDEESKLPHLAHAACCILFLIWMTKHRSELDDRYKGEK